VRTFPFKKPVQLFNKERNQMTLKRLFMPLFVVGIVFMMGSMAYAQTSINCGLSVPGGSTIRATNTGHTEPIGAGTPTNATLTPAIAGGGTVRVTCFNGPNAGTTSDPGVVALTLNLGVPITNNTSTSAGHPSTGAQVRLFNATNDFAVVGQSPTINLLTNSSGTLVIGLGQCIPPAATNCGLGVTPNTGMVFSANTTSTFDIQGILVSVNGKSGALSAFLTSTGGITVGPTSSGPGSLVGPASLNVIDNIVAGLQDPSVPTSLPNLPFFTGVSGGAAVLNSAGVPVKANFVLKIPENYQDMFRDANQFNGPGTTGNFPNSPASDTSVQIVLSNIPSGLDISGCSAEMTNAAGTALSVGSPQVSFTNITAASPVLTVNFNANTDLDNLDVLWVKCTTVGLGSATVPLPSTPVTAQVTLAPTGAALSAGNTALVALTTGQVPRYQQTLVPTAPLTVVIFPPSNTVLLMTFGFVGPGYNTGIAVANTTVDPFGVAGGGASPSSGTVSFLLVKNDGTTKTYTTTTGSPGSGLTGAGVVASGSTYVVNLSEILTAANFGTTFTGYVFVTANFTYAHGAGTIYTTSTGAAALNSPVLVLPPVTTAQVRQTPEALDQ
jgi:hypothetical protein